MAAQPARPEHMADVVGEPSHFGFHQNGDLVNQMADALFPVGLEQIDAELQSMAERSTAALRRV